MRKTLDPVELTQQLIRFDTRNPGSNEQECIDYLAGILTKAGFIISIVCFEKNRPTLIARKNKTSCSSLCFVGHIDTVPFGKADWSYDPLGAEIVGDRLYGRGASDMKSGIAAMVIAGCKCIDDLDDDSDLVLIITAGEETGCQGSKYLAHYKDLLGNAEALVVTEPSNNYPLVGHKGALWLSVKFNGRTAHGAFPEKGDNAIYHATKGISDLLAIDFAVDTHKFLGKPTINIGTVSGGLNINSVPDECEISIDLRTIPELSNTMLLKQIETVIGDKGVVETIVDVEALWSEPDHSWIKEVFNILTPYIGARPEIRTVAFFTDGPPLKGHYGGIPTVVLGPGTPSLAHQTDEYCSVKEIKEAAEIYEKLIRM